MVCESVGKLASTCDDDGDAVVEEVVGDRQDSRMGVDVADPAPDGELAETRLNSV